jgi:hypothetical protein
VGRFALALADGGKSGDDAGDEPDRDDDEGAARRLVVLRVG